MRGVTAELREKQQQSQRDLLRSEQLLLGLLRRATTLVTRRTTNFGSSQELLRNLWWRAILHGRQRARLGSRRTLLEELEAIAPGIAQLAGPRRDDTQRALRTATAFATRWRKQADEAVAEDKLPHGRAARSATRHVQSHIELVAATEVADAFNDERIETLRHAPEIVTETNPLVVLFKVWDAAMDRRTCRVCANLHGTIRPLIMDFPTRMPAHPRCRCVTTILALPAVFDFERELA